MATHAEGGKKMARSQWTNTQSEDSDTGCKLMYSHGIKTTHYTKEGVVTWMTGVCQNTYLSSFTWGPNLYLEQILERGTCSLRGTLLCNLNKSWNRKANLVLNIISALPRRLLCFGFHHWFLSAHEIELYGTEFIVFTIFIFIFLTCFAFNVWQKAFALLGWIRIVAHSLADWPCDVPLRWIRLDTVSQALFWFPPHSLYSLYGLSKWL